MKSPASQPPWWSSRRVRALALLLAVVALGAGLRFYRLGLIPPGLYQDEAFNGLDALAVIGGARPIYFPANNGREPLFIYLAALSVAAFGRSAFALRLPAAVLGTLTIPAVYALGRALFGRRVGLLAAAVLAVTFWPLALSRIGLRAVGLPLLAALSLAAAAHGYRLARAGARSGLGWLALGGTLYGLSFYTYLAARFTPLALMAFLIFWYIARRRTAPTLRELAAFGLPALIVGLPLALAGLRQPEILLGRAGQVSVLNPAINHGDLWGTLFDNLLRALGAFNWRGDGIARHNLPGRPVFDPALGLAFLAGVGVAGWRAVRQRSVAHALPVIWTAVMLLPTILAEDTPHFLRAAGVLPGVALLPALAFDWLARLPTARPWARWLGRAAAAAALALGLLLTVRDYFGRYAAAPGTAYLFQSAAADLAHTSDAFLAAGDGPRLYLDRRYWDQFASVRFLLPEQPGLVLYDAGQALPPGAAPEVRVITWPYEPARPALGALPVGALVRPEWGPLYRGDLEPEPYALYASYTASPVCPAIDCAAPPVAEFEGGLRLRAWRVRPAAAGPTLELVWQAGAAPGRDYQVFAHARLGDALLAQADGPLGSDLYPSGWWRDGEVVLEQRAFALPRPVSLANLDFLVGVYDLATGARLHRTDAPGDAVALAP